MKGTYMLKSTIASAALLCSLLLSSNVQAVDWKSLPGSVCHATDNYNTQTHTSAHYYYQTKTNGYAVCPVVKDNTGNTGFAGLWIYGRQPQFVTGSWCEAGSSAVNGGGVVAYNWDYLPEHGDPEDRIDFGTSLNAGQTNGLLYINCWLVGDGTTGGSVHEILYKEP